MNMNENELTLGHLASAAKDEQNLWGSTNLFLKLNDFIRFLYNVKKGRSVFKLTTYKTIATLFNYHVLNYQKIRNQGHYSTLSQNCLMTW